jgi:hypothetical protein
VETVLHRTACSRPPRQDPQTVARAAPACSTHALKIAMLRPGGVLCRSKKPIRNDFYGYQLLDRRTMCPAALMPWRSWAY